MTGLQALPLWVAVFGLAVGGSACGGSSDDGQSEAEREAALEQRIERERREAARDARQEERIKQLERELRSKTTGSGEPPSSSGSTGSSALPAESGSPSNGGDWPGGAGYTVVLASETSESAARATQRQASNAGLDAGVLQSSAYSSLRSGYWVVFSGVYSSSDAAKERQARARSLGFGDAYIRFVAP